MRDGAIKVQLAGKDRELYFDINTLAEVDDLLRTGIVGLCHSNDWRVSDVRTVLWAGLKSEDPKLTREQVGEIIFEHMRAGGFVYDLTAMIYKALFAAGFLREEKKTEAPPESPSPASVNGSGKPSETLTDH